MTCFSSARPRLGEEMGVGEAGGDRCGHDRGHHPHHLYLEDPSLSQSRSFPTFGTRWPRSSVLASSAALFRSMLSKIPPISFPPIQWSADCLLQHTDSNLQVGDFLSSVLNKMAIEGKMRTHKTWRDSGLKWTDMVGF